VPGEMPVSEWLRRGDAVLAPHVPIQRPTPEAPARPVERVYAFGR
jgi:hypothetical protein